ncbi:acyltransferase family protein [Pseudochrobactrum sp. HB0163]|uniref:acyltransferase family protein n=1 Tax=Pseudochrobactrum sp. HB0163 TaxID=3450708 RepID=UPI003F6DF616
MTKRIDWVDIAKGICIIFVVMMHSTLGVEEAAGRDGWMHFVVAFAKPFRMPDFFLISGLFLSAVIDRPWLRYFDRKVVHFLYFYVLWLTIQFLFKAPAIMGDGGIQAVISAYLMAFIEPFGTLWFIYLLPVFFLATRFMREVPAWLVLIMLAILEILPIHTGWVMIDEFCARFVYFYAGYALAPQIFQLANFVAKNKIMAVSGLLLWFFVEYQLVFTPVPEFGRSLLGGQAWQAGGLGGYSELPLISLFLGFLGALAIISLSSLLSCLSAANIMHRALSFLGAHSIVVYLAFFLPMAVTRTVLLKTGVISDIGTISVLTTAAGVILPVILYMLIDKTGYGRFLFERPQWAIIDKKTVQTVRA